MTTRIKVRGIYATALTRLLLDWDYAIVQPSVKIQERFGLGETDDPYDILIQDRLDQQGIEAVGEADKVCQLLTFLQERLTDVILLKLGPREEDDGLVAAEVEFPGASKERLDEARSRVTPTVMRHHRLRVVDSRAVEDAEAGLEEHPEEKGSIEGRLYLEMVLLPLEKTPVVRLEHIRPSGKPMRPREGVLMSVGDHKIIFKRTFSSGHYDGLDIPIQSGDYSLTEIEEDAWYVKHAYFSKSGKLRGEYYNINTPVEIYPYGARYLDLEVDVIRRAGEEPFIIDREKLALLTRRGCISPALEQRAMGVVDDLIRSIA